MKQITSYIIEGLHINKNIKVKNYKDIEVKLGEKTNFTENEIKEIKEFCNDLPIIPDIITNYISSQPKDTKRKHSSYIKTIINLVYYRNENIQPDKHENNIIRITKDVDSNQYFIRFAKINEIDTYFYPEDTDKYFESIKECFDCIKDKWKELKFSEIINKYK